MNLEHKAASFFLYGKNISEDFHKLCEAADNDAPIPEDVEVLEEFEDNDAETLVKHIYELKKYLYDVRQHAIIQTLKSK